MRWALVYKWKGGSLPPQAGPAERLRAEASDSTDARFRIMRGRIASPRVAPAYLVDHGGGFPQVTPIILGVILLIIGFVAKVAIFWTLGIIAVIVGAILALPGFAGHSAGGRRHYY